MKTIFLDIETTGLDPRKDKIHGMSILYEEDAPAYYRIDELPEELLQDLKDSQNVVVIHTGRRYDLKFLHFAGIEVNCRIHDTYFIFKEIDENQPLGLKELTKKYLGIDNLANKNRLDKEIERAGVKNLATFCKIDMELPSHPYTETIAKYCNEDVNNMFRLYYVGKQKLGELRQKLRKVFGNSVKDPINHLRDLVVPLESVLFDMDKQGVKADLGLLERTRTEKERARGKLLEQLYLLNKDFVDNWETRAYKVALLQRKSPEGKKKVKKGSKKYKTLFNWGSGEHVGELIYDHYDIPENLIKRSEKTGKYTIDKYQIMDLKVALGKEHPAYNTLCLYEKYKTYEKLVNTYTGNAKRGIFSQVHEGRLWTEYTQTTKTWRLASRNPNLQNIKNDSIVHKFFIPDDESKVFFVADYSQIELRLAAHYSQEPKLLEAYRNNEDIHAKTANTIGADNRQVGKCVDPNTLLLIDNKYQRIGEVVSRRTKGWEDLSHLTTYNNGETVLINKGYCDGIKDRYLVVGRKGMLVCSESHKILTDSGELKTLLELKDTDVLVYSSLPTNTKIISQLKYAPFNNNHSKSEFNINITPELAYFAGVFTGDGTTNSGNSAGICTGGTDKYLKWAETLRESVEAIGLKATVNRPQVSKSGSSISIYIGSRRVVEFLKVLGLIGINEKKSLSIPSWVLNGTKEVKLNFIAGLIDTDGYCHSHGGSSICSKSWVLIQDLSVLASSLNLHYSLYTKFNTKYNRHYYNIFFSKRHNSTFLEYLKCQWKVKAIKSQKASTNKAAYNNKTFDNNQVKAIIKLEPGTLLDLSLDSKEKLYTANTFVTHNTGNFLWIYRGSWKMFQFMMKRQAGIELNDEDAKFYTQRFWEEYQVLDAYLYEVDREMRQYGLVHCEETGAIRRLPDLVYGEYLNWKEHEFTGPPELAKRAITELHNDWRNRNRRSKEQPPVPTKEQVFWKCYDFYRHAKKQGFNFRCQHMAMYICGLVMIKLREKGFKIINQIHDSLTIQLDKSELHRVQEIVDIMENTYKISVPIKVDWQLQTTFDKQDKYE